MGLRRTRPANHNGPTKWERVKSGEMDAPENWATYPAPSLPMDVADRLVDEVFTSSAGHMLVRYRRGEWWKYTGTHWQLVEEDLDVREPLWRRLQEVVVDKGDDKGTSPWSPTTPKITNIMEPLAIITRLPAASTPPYWIDGTHPEGTVVSLRNQLVNLDTGDTYPHTPNYFTTWSLPFDYDPQATCPEWENFMADTYAHDPAAVDTMQEWFGCVLSGRTDFQKGLLLVGPTGSGKGTQDRTLKALVGEGNVAATSFQTLNSGFGLANWLGKPLAVIGDSRDSGTIGDAATSKLLSVIGEDAVPVEKKGVDVQSEVLPTRVMVMSNEMPSFKDSSGALVKRWVVVETKVSHRDNPDRALGNRIMGELSGIFNWALIGLRRLEKQGHFTQPESTVETIEMMHDTAAPEAMFITENYTVTGDTEDYMWLSDIYDSYQLWTTKRGHKPLSQNRFKSKLKAAGIPGVTITKRTHDDKRKEVVAGVHTKLTTSLAGPA